MVKRGGGPQLIMADCLACGHLIQRGRHTYLYSLTRKRNVGPFHPDCARDLTIEQEDEIWRFLDAGGETPVTRGEEPGWEPQ